VSEYSETFNFQLDTFILMPAILAPVINFKGRDTWHNAEEDGSVSYEKIKTGKSWQEIMK
jgi:hypothetical protein